MEALNNNREEGYIQYEQRMDGENCGTHVIEVKICNIISKQKKVLT